jgi:uncharacterized protein
MVMKPDYEEARRYALAQLEDEIDPALTYHNLSHTRDDVLPAAEKLAQHSDVREDDLLLLRTAALFHDIGFTRQRLGHEEAGIAIASAVLPGFGYSAEQIAVISAMIRATKLPQQPHTLLEEILADADLAVLGGTNFVERNYQLRDEMAVFEGPVSDEAWYTSQIAFVGSHQYFTAAARQLFDPRKQGNLAFLKEQLAQSKHSP